MVYEGFQGFDPSTYVTPFETACASGASSKSCTDYTAGRIADIQKEATDRKSNSFAKTYIDLQRTINMDHNATSYGIRNQDVATMNNFISDYNTALDNNTQYNIDVSKRQFEINEYFYYNKLDTLFFLQVFFIVGLIMAIILYGNRIGYMSTRQSGIATLILTLLVVIIGVSRYFYTTRTRDNRLWHRRYFGTEDEDKPALLNCPKAEAGAPSGVVTVDFNALFDKKTTQCASDAYKAGKQWFNELNTETQKFQDCPESKTNLFKKIESCSA